VSERMSDLIEMLFREIVRKIVPNFREKKIEKRKFSANFSTLTSLPPVSDNIAHCYDFQLSPTSNVVVSCGIAVLSQYRGTIFDGIGTV